MSAFIQIAIENLNSLVMHEVGLALGVDGEIKHLSSTLSTIQDVVQDAEENLIKTKPILAWMRKIQEFVYEIEDMLDECATHFEVVQHKYGASKRSYLMKKGEEYMFNLRNGKRIKQASHTLTVIAAERVRFHLRGPKHDLSASRETSSVLNNSQHVYGMEEEKEMIVDTLMNHAATRRVTVLPLIGIGGQGKTTLAKLAYNDERLVEHFDQRLWVYVGDSFDVKSLIRGMIESASGSATNLEHMDALQRELTNLLAQRRFLLVLDDVWNEDQAKWSLLRDILECGSTGTSVLITTRQKNIADIMGTLPAHDLKKLSDEHCMMLLKECAFGRDEQEHPDLLAIVEELAKKCHGVPLAARVLGSLLQFKRTQRDWISVKESRFFELPKDELSLLSVLRLSYRHLSFELRRCFAYCGTFPQKIQKEELIFGWMAHGYISSKGRKEVEEVGDEICNDLLCRSILLEDPDGEKDVFTMHPIVRELAESLMPGPEKFNSSTTYFRQVNWGDQCAAFPVSKVSGMPWILSTKLFSRLRILNASGQTVEEVEDIMGGIGKFKYLRYLNLSGSDIRTLRDSTSQLWNLKILNLNSCVELVALPRNLKRLKNLRHLFLEGCTSLEEMPRGIRELTKLRTLSMFIVGENGKNKLDELQCLNLGGKLEIRHVERLEESSAEKANLIAKENLRHLSFVWQESARPMSVDEQVLGALEPHPNLKILHISGFKGSCLPTWMANLTSLEDLTLEECPVLASLSANIQQLPNLRLLVIKRCPELERRHERLEIWGYKGKRLQPWTSKMAEQLDGHFWEGLNNLMEINLTDCSEYEELPM